MTRIVHKHNGCPVLCLRMADIGPDSDPMLYDVGDTNNSWEGKGTKSADQMRCCWSGHQTCCCVYWTLGYESTPSKDARQKATWIIVWTASSATLYSTILNIYWGARAIPPPPWGICSCPLLVSPSMLLRNDKTFLARACPHFSWINMLFTSDDIWVTFVTFWEIGITVKLVYCDHVWFWATAVALGRWSIVAAPPTQWTCLLLLYDTVPVHAIVYISTCVYRMYMGHSTIFVLLLVAFDHETWVFQWNKTCLSVLSAKQLVVVGCVDRSLHYKVTI